MASRVVRARLDLASEKALESLVAQGGTESSVVRSALIELARERQRAALREEARRIGADPADRAEVRRLLEELESSSPPWPD